MLCTREIDLVTLKKDIHVRFEESRLFMLCMGHWQTMAGPTPLFTLSLQVTESLKRGMMC